jgi:hypothetical protein
MTHWRKFFDYRFIAAEELDGKEVNLTIAAIEWDEVYSREDKKNVRKGSIRFKETTKKLVLNKTNAKKLTELFASGQVESWVGKRVCLYPTSERSFGQMIDVIRIKKCRDNSAELTAPEFKEIQFDNQPETEPAAVEEGGRE